MDKDTLSSGLSLFIEFFIFLLKDSWIYDVVLVSGVQLNNSVTHVCTYSFSYSFPLWFITGNEYRSLCYTVDLVV